MKHLEQISNAASKAVESEATASVDSNQLLIQFLERFGLLVIREIADGVKLWVKKDNQFEVEFRFGRNDIAIEWSRLYSKVSSEMFVAEGLPQHADDTVQLLHRVCKSMCIYHCTKPISEKESDILYKKYPENEENFQYLVVYVPFHRSEKIVKKLW